MNDRWEEARALWLEGQRSEHTRRQYARPLRMLEAFTGKPLGETSAADVTRFNGNMIREGKSEATRAVYLSALTSYFDFVMRMEGGLLGGNPVARVARPEVQKFGKVGSLDVEQIRALLQAITTRITRSQGKRQAVHLRNRAMVLFYLMTGKRNSEVRNLKWGQIRRGARFAGQPVKAEVRWTVKGGENHTEVLPAPLWTACEAYVDASGRALGENDYLFVALEDPFEGVPAGRPITDRMVRVMVSRYAKAAGLTHVTVHMLRHSSAMLLKLVGASAMDIQQHLGHSHLNTTQIYLDQLESYENKHWTKVADLLGLPSDNTPYRREDKNGVENGSTRKGYPLNLRMSKKRREKV